MNWSDDLTNARRRRLHVDVAETLLQGIKDGTWPAGGRLPSDRDLAERLGVSRPTVREALLVLKFGGLIEIRHGSGAYVIGDASSVVQDQVVGSDSPQQLVEARIQVEPIIAKLCATRLSDHQIDDLSDLVALSERAVDSRENPVELVRLGLQFHRALADGCGNQYLTGFCRALVSMHDHPLWNLLHRDVLTTPESRLHEVVEHRRVIDAIRAHDPVAAGRTMKEHLQGLWSTVLDDPQALDGAKKAWVN